MLVLAEFFTDSKGLTQRSLYFSTVELCTSALVVVSWGNKDLSPAAPFAGHRAVESRHVVENPEACSFTKVVDEDSFHKVDSRQFRRLIAPGAESWRPVAVLVAAATPSALPERAKAGDSNVIP